MITSLKCRDEETDALTQYPGQRRAWSDTSGQDVGVGALFQSHLPAATDTKSGLSLTLCPDSTSAGWPTGPPFVKDSDW